MLSRTFVKTSQTKPRKVSTVSYRSRTIGNSKRFNSYERTPQQPTNFRPPPLGGENDGGIPWGKILTLTILGGAAITLYTAEDYLREYELYRDLNKKYEDALTTLSGYIPVSVKAIAPPTSALPKPPVATHRAILETEIDGKNQAHKSVKETAASISVPEPIPEPVTPVESIQVEEVPEPASEPEPEQIAVHTEHEAIPIIVEVVEPVHQTPPPIEEPGFVATGINHLEVAHSALAEKLEHVTTKLAQMEEEYSIKVAALVKLGQDRDQEYAQQIAMATHKLSTLHSQEINKLKAAQQKALAALRESGNEELKQYYLHRLNEIEVATTQSFNAASVEIQELWDQAMNKLKHLDTEIETLASLYVRYENRDNQQQKILHLYRSLLQLQEAVKPGKSFEGELRAFKEAASHIPELDELVQGIPDSVAKTGLTSNEQVVTDFDEIIVEARIAALSKADDNLLDYVYVLFAIH